MKTRFFILTSVLTMSVALTLYGQAPQLINYQGNLNQDGGPANGTFNIAFSIYDSATDGTQLWTEQQPVSVTDGLFNVLLGSSVSFPSELFKAEGDRYLGFKVESDDEMTPRFQLTSVAYALRATQADTAQFTRVAGMSVGNSLDAADGDPTGAVFVDNDGNVGIGTSSPASPFHVKRSGQANQVVARIERGETSLAFGSENNTHGAIASDGGLIFRTNWDGGTETDTATLGMAIDKSGNVGIGTTSPAGVLEVIGTDGVKTLVARGNSDQTADILDLQNSDGVSFFTVNSQGRLLINSAGSASVVAVGINNNKGTGMFTSSNNLAFARGGTLVMTLTDGNVGIGTTSPGQKLEVDTGNILVKGTNRFINVNDEAVVYLGDTNHYIKAVNGVGLRLGTFLAEDALVMQQSTGNVGIGTTNPTERLHVNGKVRATDFVTSSSRDYKKNIQDLSAAQAKAALSQMNPVQYQYKSDDLGDQHVGFIAEDVPELVATPGRKGVSALDMVAVLTKVVQEQQKTIEQLKEDMADIRKKVD